MTNALNNLRLRWRGRQEELKVDRKKVGSDRDQSNWYEGREVELEQCIRDLAATVDGVKPIPLNEHSTEVLYKWAGRFVAIFNLAIEAKGAGDYIAQGVGHDLGTLADQEFLNEVYDLFKQLANRRSEG